MLTKRVPQFTRLLTRMLFTLTLTSCSPSHCSESIHRGRVCNFKLNSPIFTRTLSDCCDTPRFNDNVSRWAQYLGVYFNIDLSSQSHVSASAKAPRSCPHPKPAVSHSGKKGSCPESDSECLRLRLRRCRGVRRLDHWHDLRLLLLYVQDTRPS
jgi:hypothetical protein